MEAAPDDNLRVQATMMQFHKASALLLCVGLGGCVAGTFNDPDTVAFQRAVAEQIPLHSDAHAAQRKLTKAGYRCQPPHENVVSALPTQNLVCFKSGTPIGRIVERYWRIELDVQGGNVTAVRPTVSATVI
jgi:hypothetical protein